MVKMKCQKSKISGNSKTKCFRVVRKLRFQTKAQYAADTSVYYVVFGIVISLLFLSFMWLLAYYTTDTSKVPDGIEYEIITERFLSSNCFGYETLELDIPQRDIIDWYGFTQDNLDYCYESTSAEQLQFILKLVLKTPPKESVELKTKQWSDAIGLDKEEIMDVLIFYEDNMREGQLIIRAQGDLVRFK